MPTAAERVESVDLMRLLSALPVGIAHLTNERIDYANPALLELLQATEEWLLGTSFVELIHPDERAAVEARYWARVGGDKAVPPSYETTLRRADGSDVRVELGPKALGERELVVLVRGVAGRGKDSALLAALSSVALQVQRARTPREVLWAAGEGLRGLGMNLAALRLSGPDELAVEHLNSDERILRALESLFGLPWRSWRFSLASLPMSSRALAEKRDVFHDAITEALVGLVRRSGSPDAARAEEQILRAGWQRGVLCPLFVHGEPWGFLDIASATLTASDAAAVGLFASKVASALEVTSTIAELERKNRELVAIQELAEAGSETDFELLLPELLRIACGAVQSDAGALYLLDGNRAQFVLAADHGGIGALRTKYSVLPISSPIGRAALTLESTALGSSPLLADFSRELAAEGIREMAVVPLHIKGRLAGTLNLARCRPEPFTEDELRFASQLSGQVAIQVENARLYADTNRRVKLLTVLFGLSRMGAEALEVAPLVERVLDKISDAIPVEAVALHLLEGNCLRLAGERGEGGSWDQAAVIPLDRQMLCGRAAVERRTQVVDLSSWPESGAELARGRGITHAVAVPLVASDRLIGTLCVLRRADRAFVDEEIGLLESSAAQISLAIERARLFEQERKRVEELQLFLEIGRVITASLDLELILESSAGSMARMAEATHAFIFLQEPGKRVLRGVATSASEHRDRFRTMRVSVDASCAVALAVRTRAPVRIADTTGSDLVRRELIEGYSQKSVLALPLLVRGEPIGAVLIGDTRSPRAWSDAQIDRAMAVARQVAVSVANARLYEDLKHSYDQLARAQEELVKRERLAALGELSAVVAHEVRNPLGVIFNSLGSLRRVLHPSGDAAMLLDIVGEEADRLNRIVGELLDFARPTDPALQLEPLVEVMRAAAEAAAPLAEPARVRIEIKALEPSLRAPVDAHMLRQALLNLIINAIQAMPKGGTVTVAASTEGREGRKVARIEVSDTGAGISPDLAGRIFQPFFTTKASGTGLGLAVVKRTVEAHRGELELDSPPGRGAKFVLRLPLEQR
ncbi:MAG: GAF domain-containing protein [Myxococcales bacterium]|jgi:PAS domain S-box-containing protein